MVNCFYYLLDHLTRTDVFLWRQTIARKFCFERSDRFVVPVPAVIGNRHATLPPLPKGICLHRRFPSFSNNYSSHVKAFLIAFVCKDVRMLEPGTNPSYEFTCIFMDSRSSPYYDVVYQGFCEVKKYVVTGKNIFYWSFTLSS